MAGLVFAGERKVDKPGQPLADDAALDVRGRDHPWVSRGGIKLAHALDAFRLGRHRRGRDRCRRRRPAASPTCCSAAARRRVYAVDSGTNQLAWKLRQDPRVIVHRTDQRAHPDRSAYLPSPST